MNNLVLVGFSCSGKTTVGRVLARRLGLQFVDTDRLIEHTARRSIPAIFRDDGEEAFRAFEREAVRRVCCQSRQVISTGGGAWIDLENRALLACENLVVHLRVRPATVVERLKASHSGRPRPLLDAPDPLARVTDLMAERAEAYADAHVVLDVDERTTFGLAADVVAHWYRWRRSRRVARQAERVAR